MPPDRRLQEIADGAPPMRGQVAVVTGSSRGIGRAIALCLAREGADVCVAARSATELAAVVEEIERHGVRGIAVAGDLTDPEQIEALVEAVVAELGGINVLVNNIGGAHRIRPIEGLSDRDFEQAGSLNYDSVQRTMRAAAPHLFEAAPEAAVLNVVSIAAQRGLAGMSYYSGSKAGVVGFSRAAAREWGPRGVRVNCLGPGWIETDLSERLRSDGDFFARSIEEIALGRWGQAAEVAEAATFLVSPRSSYVTGATLYADGGLLA